MSENKKNRRARNPLAAAASVALPIIGGLFVSQTQGATRYIKSLVTTNYWNTTAPWSAFSTTGTDNASFPNAVDDIAYLTKDITASRTITMGQDITIGTMYIGDPNLSGPSSYTINGSNTLTFQVSTGNAVLSKTVANGVSDFVFSQRINLASNLTVSNANSTSAGALFLGSNNGSLGTNGIIEGAGSLTINSGYVVIGASDPNTYTGDTTINSGATVEVYRSARLGNNGTLHLAGGNIILDGGLQPSDYNSHPFMVTGTSQLTTNGSNALYMGATTIGGTLNLVAQGASLQSISFGNGTTLTANSIINASNNSADSMSTVTVDSGVADNTTTALSLTGSQAMTITGAMTDYSPTRKLGLIVNSTNTTTLNAASTYTGNTTINGGILKLAGGGSISNSAQIDLAGGTLDTSAKPSFAIANGQTLEGQGAYTASASTTIGGTSAGTLIIGQSQGVNSGGAQTLSVNVGNSGGTLTLASNSTSEFDLWSGGGSSDVLALTGTGNSLAYGGTLQVANPSGFTFTAGQSWDLFNFTNRAGSTVFTNNAVFGTAGDGVNLPTLASGLKWNFDYSQGVLSIASVPEPVGLGLVMLGLAGALTRRRRRC